MIKFVKFLFKLIFILFFTLVILDVTYTFVKIKSEPRNKIDKIINSKNETFDVIILGSSRAENHLVSKMFIKNGYKTFNYGISGARLDENLLELKLMLENNFKIKNIILQVDINIENEEYSKVVQAQFMPYFHTSEIIKNHYKKLPNYNSFFYIPFYRYIYYDTEIGFRETIFTILKKESKILKNNGFVGLKGTVEVLSFDKSKNFPQKNNTYEEIKFICKKNKINLISISTPVCENHNNIYYFKKIIKLYPEIIDFHSIIKNDNYFYSCGHMNEEGAKLFTKIIIDSISIK